MHIDTAIATFGDGIDMLAGSIETHMGGRVARDIERVRLERIAEGVPAELAARSARWPWLHTGFDMVHLAFSENCDVASAAATYGSVFEAFDIGWLWIGIGALPRSDRWQTQARSSMRDDLMNVMAELTRSVMRSAHGSPVEWIAAHQRSLDHTSRCTRRSAAPRASTSRYCLWRCANFAI
ncbi:MAG: NAD-glutamate dehydrogenase [Ilumatobacter sp.]|nr:NAD-glutamate dehydrogenase [Ilumatobacter sp.]